MVLVLHQLEMIKRSLIEVVKCFFGVEVCFVGHTLSDLDQDSHQAIIHDTYVFEFSLVLHFLNALVFDGAKALGLDEDGKKSESDLCARLASEVVGLFENGFGSR